MPRSNRRAWSLATTSRFGENKTRSMMNELLVETKLLYCCGHMRFITYEIVTMLCAEVVLLPKIWRETLAVQQSNSCWSCSHVRYRTCHPPAACQLACLTQSIATVGRAAAGTAAPHAFCRSEGRGTFVNCGDNALTLITADMIRPSGMVQHLLSCEGDGLSEGCEGQVRTDIQLRLQPPPANQIPTAIETMVIQCTFNINL